MAWWQRLRAVRALVFARARFIDCARRSVARTSGDSALQQPARHASAEVAARRPKPSLGATVGRRDNATVGWTLRRAYVHRYPADVGRCGAGASTGDLAADPGAAGDRDIGARVGVVTRTLRATQRRRLETTSSFARRITTRPVPGPGVIRPSLGEQQDGMATMYQCAGAFCPRRRGHTACDQLVGIPVEESRTNERWSIRVAVPEGSHWLVACVEVLVSSRGEPEIASTAR